MLTFCNYVCKVALEVLGDAGVVIAAVVIVGDCKENKYCGGASGNQVEQPSRVQYSEDVFRLAGLILCVCVCCIRGYGL